MFVKTKLAIAGHQETKGTEKNGREQMRTKHINQRENKKKTTFNKATHGHTRVRNKIEGMPGKKRTDNAKRIIK